MSILIKGMEMPKLYKTYKVRFSEEGGKILVGFADENSTAYRPIGEAIPVPAHGRLGDLDELEAEMRRKTNERFCVNMVCDAPTIIPAEEGET